LRASQPGWRFHFVVLRASRSGWRFVSSRPHRAAWERSALMRRPDLVPDCASCAAVCCIATSFDASEDFAFDKAAGVGCRYLGRDCRCAIHDELLDRGFRGCAVYDCFGAGPRVTRAFAGMQDCDRERDDAFLVLRVVHEQLWLLTQAAMLFRDAGNAAQPAPEIHREPGAELDREVADQTAREIAGAIAREVDLLDAIVRQEPFDLLDFDPQPYVERARFVLGRVGEALGGRRRARLLLAVVG
jgi:hypothetical protein